MGNGQIEASLYYLMIRAHDHVWRMRELPIAVRLHAGSSLMRCLHSSKLGATVPAVVVDGKRMIEVHGE